MKTNQVQTYTCEICNKTYNTAEGALKCESKPVTKDKGVEVGDRVLVTNGEGRGHYAVVTHVGVHDKEWGHYHWERYWHTVFVSADLVGSYGSRTLSFDSYDTV